MAGGDSDTYAALIDQVFGRFAVVIGTSSVTGYNWNTPPPYIQDELTTNTVVALLL